MIKKLISVFISLSILSSLFSVNAFAYNYSTKVYSGNGGAFERGTELTLTNVGTLTFVTAYNSESGTAYITDGENVYNIILPEDSIYYAKGFHRAGHEEILAETVCQGSEQFVIAYGVSGEKTEYTVRYLDKQGNPLMADTVGFGADGEKAVVAYRYIEGYIPQAYNLSKTLVKGEENVFTFTYHPISELTTEETETIIVGSTIVNPDGTSGSQNAENSDEPQEIIDLDDENVPAGTQTDNGNSADNPSDGTNGNVTEFIPYIAGAAGLLFLLLLWKKKKSENEENK